MGVKMCTIHLDGGPEMIRAALEAAGDKMQILGITVLTSISQEMFNKALGMPGLISDRVMFLTYFGYANGVRWIVSSGFETQRIKKAFGGKIFVATPGIRFMETGTDRNQKRVVTPFLAIGNGSDLVVMGSDLLKGGPEAAERAVDEIYRAFLIRDNESKLCG
jgi:orotidine-5'-phosphate decarboxylase